MELRERKRAHRKNEDMMKRLKENIESNEAKAGLVGYPSSGECESNINGNKNKS